MWPGGNGIVFLEAVEHVIMLLCRSCPFRIPVVLVQIDGQGAYFLCIAIFFSIPLTAYLYHSSQTPRPTSQGQMAVFSGLCSFIFTQTSQY